MRRFIAVALSAVAALAFAGTAAADPPTIFTEPTLTVSEPQLNFSCVPHGYTFDVLSTFSVERHFIQFFEGGALVKEIRHISFEGTLYRSDDLTKTIPYAGKSTRTYRVAANLVVNTGLVRYSHPDGSGMVALDPGRTVLTWPPPPIVLADTGPTGPEWEQGVCSYLSQA
jgi:hypothetical protein